MSDDLERGDSGQAADAVKHTPEEQAAFDERIEMMAGYTELVRDEAVADLAEAQAQAEEARAGGDDALAESISERASERMRRALMLVVALVVALIVALILWFGGGTDLTASLGGNDSKIDEIAPPEPAATPEEVLPAEVFQYVCADCGDATVTQVPLDLNPDAKYQFAYEAGGSRIAILTVVDGSEYDEISQTITDDYNKLVASGQDVEAPRVLDDVADGAIVYQTIAVFKNGDECGLLWANTLQDAAGEEFTTIPPDELERLARIAAPRM